MGQAQSDEYECETTEEIENNSKDIEVTYDKNKESDGGKKKVINQKNSNKTNKNNLKKQDKNCSTSIGGGGGGGGVGSTRKHEHVRKLSNVSHRNIQLLSLKPRSEKDAYVDDLRTRRRSSLINLILGAPSCGPRFSDDLCSLSSHLSECNFGIEFFPDTYHAATSTSSLRLESIEDIEKGGVDNQSGVEKIQQSTKIISNQNKQYRRRRSSIGSLNGSSVLFGIVSDDPSGTIPEDESQRDKKLIQYSSSSPSYAHQARQQFYKTSLATSTMKSIDLTSSFERQQQQQLHDKSDRERIFSYFRSPFSKNSNNKQAIFEDSSGLFQDANNNNSGSNNNKDSKTIAPMSRVNQSGRVLRRTASELSLYSTISNGSSGGNSSGSNGSYNIRNGGRGSASGGNNEQSNSLLKETKLIIILQVCLPFILAGFGNMAAGLVLNRVAHWKAFHNVPTFFILLPPLVGMKGNIEMTLASRLSTLSNLRMLDTSYQKRRAYLSNLILILSQAIGLSSFAAIISVVCEFLISGSTLLESNLNNIIGIAIFVVLASALATSIILVLISSIIMSLAIGLANLIQVNPDNLSTLIAALYGDVSFVIVYGLISNWMYSLRDSNILTWPILIIVVTLFSWPILTFMAYKFKETHSIALTSLPPMLTSIFVSMGSGAVLSLVVDRYKLIALYQPVVNGFGANLIAVQASRVSTWLWCSALRKISITRGYVENTPKKTLASLASFTEPEVKASQKDSKQYIPCNPLERLRKILKKVLWSFCNNSPNSVAAKMLLIMIIPAHTIYFFVIWLMSSTNYITITWQFYLIYICLCLLQVFILLIICEPLMTLLMNRNLDPDVFGISLLMALADLFGTLCLSGAFFVLEKINDVNAL